MKNLRKGISFCVLIFSFTFLLLTFTVTCYALDLSRIKACLLNGDYKSAITEGERLIAGNPHSDELYYLLGLAYLKDTNYLRSSDIFEVIIKEFSGSKFKEEATLGLGDTYLLREDFAKARKIYQEIIKSNPATKLKSQVYYRLSEIGFKEGDTAQGKAYQIKLREAYPLAPEIKQSQDICPVEKNNFNFYYSIQIGSFSNALNAQNLTKKLLESGFPAYIDESLTLAGTKTYRVKVGKLQTRQETEVLHKKLIQEGYPTKICP